MLYCLILRGLAVVVNFSLRVDVANKTIQIKFTPNSKSSAKKQEFASSHDPIGNHENTVSKYQENSAKTTKEMVYVLSA